MWADANGGAFPSNDIVAIRFGDECFNLTGWVDSPACSFPLWGFSESGRAAFAAAAANSSLVTRHSSRTGAASTALVQPRTWGFPEIYGAEACGIAVKNTPRASSSFPSPKVLPMMMPTVLPMVNITILKRFDTVVEIFRAPTASSPR